ALISLRNSPPPSAENRDRKQSPRGRKGKSKSDGRPPLGLRSRGLRAPGGEHGHHPVFTAPSIAPAVNIESCGQLHFRPSHGSGRVANATIALARNNGICATRFKWLSRRYPGQI